MDSLNLIENSYILTAIFFCSALFAFWILYRLIIKMPQETTTEVLRRQLAMIFLLLFAIICIVLIVPFFEGVRGHIFSLIGILLSGALALSSTTHLGNIVAGILLRSVRSFRSGDFIRVEKHFGRVSGRGLFHVEIQTRDRDLTTIPNLYLATQPVKVIRDSGTIIGTTLSLGYEVPRLKIEAALIEAAEAAGLVDPFVYITELGDFSVSYKISGMLTKVKHLFSAQSTLNAMVLDYLHKENIEIVSPRFMNQRDVSELTFIPEGIKRSARGPVIREIAPEDKVFDKAQQAEILENLQDRVIEIGTEIEKLQEERKDLSEQSALEKLDKTMEKLNNQKIITERKIQILTKELDQLENISS